MRNKTIVVAFVVCTVAIVFFLSRKFLTLDYLIEVSTQLKDFYQSQPLIVYSLAFLIYVLVTGLSIPGATAMTLIYAWFFGFLRAMVLVSFASTAGAAMAFLLSRYLFRDWVQQRFGERLTTINAAMETEGPFYLFTLRLIPSVPFFAVNAVMGLTRIHLFTFWWVSQLGMLAGTAVYVYAGSRVPDLLTLKREGIGAVFSSEQMLQIGIALTLIGIFPLSVKWLTNYFRNRTNGNKPNESS